nr:MAG TPA: hypothetical protein [Caudoviricetes sp.]
MLFNYFNIFFWNSKILSTIFKFEYICYKINILITYH